MGSVSFAERIKQFFGVKNALSEDVFDDLADLLIEGDFGAAEAFHTVEELQSICKKNKLSDIEEVRIALAELLEQKIVSKNPPQLDKENLTVILLLGVNGVGKTTSAAKLANMHNAAGEKVILAAADTFRAAAVDQLIIHGERLGIRVVAHKQGGDPAAVIYDAIETAKAGTGNLIIADTAGRMHTKNSLVEELKKIDRVVESKAGNADYYKWLVLDSTTGRNALAQAEIFHEAVKLDGVILTKYDSSARGGIVFSLSETLKLPVLYVCDGEKYENIKAFNPHVYTREFLGLE
ncbi:MAG: signal recognition particle-docking protein FtsY [Treponema sp.]|jgi:fused signal recognition particle receptor|nr:signal recognition particle-docking protein FtsY [Treponema sp.]